MTDAVLATVVSRLDDPNAGAATAGLTESPLAERIEAN